MGIISLFFFFSEGSKGQCNHYKTQIQLYSVLKNLSINFHCASNKFIVCVPFSPPLLAFYSALCCIHLSFHQPTLSTLNTFYHEPLHMLSIILESSPQLFSGMALSNPQDFSLNASSTKRPLWGIRSNPFLLIITAPFASLIICFPM